MICKYSSLFKKCKVSAVLFFFEIALLMKLNTISFGSGEIDRRALFGLLIIVFFCFYSFGLVLLKASVSVNRNRISFFGDPGICSIILDSFETSARTPEALRIASTATNPHPRWNFSLYLRRPIKPNPYEKNFADKLQFLP